MKHYNKFLPIHELLKKYECKSTYDFEKEYRELIILGGHNFYKPESEMHNDAHCRKYEEEVDAALDVSIPVKWSQATKYGMRINIEYSNRAKLYSMYISLPTSSRSKSLSLNTYKTSDEVMAEIRKWIKLSGAKATFKKNKDDFSKITVEKNQIDLFDFVN